MTDDRPSIAELQRLIESINYKGPHEANRLAISALINAAPVLLEIAAAALARDKARKAFEWSAANEDRPLFENKRHAMNLAHDTLTTARDKVVS